MSNVQSLAEVRIANSRTACANCGLHRDCLPAGLNVGDLARLDALITPRYVIRRGEHLCRAGARLQSLFAIRSGSLKSSVTDQDGHEQIVGFFLAGELLGMDAIGRGSHVCDVIALEDCEVCRIPFAELQQLCREIPALARNLNSMMSREIGRGYGVMLLLGSMNAEERIATFLLSLSRRFRARGFSPSQLLMRMTRHEIGSYLGLKLETVSRVFSRFQRAAIVSVKGKEIRLLNPDKLRGIVEHADPQLDGLLANADAAVRVKQYPADTRSDHAAAAIVP